MDLVGWFVSLIPLWFFPLSYSVSLPPFPLGQKFCVGLIIRPLRSAHREKWHRDIGGPGKTECFSFFTHAVVSLYLGS
ncbi:hypothetical protein F4819DRAFT_170318 [Hypoxylon fuscum]|nr:hypothetical protein F4819DRAFT_170318 [Hypoxylon fuscum]